MSSTPLYCNIGADLFLDWTPAFSPHVALALAHMLSDPSHWFFFSHYPLYACRAVLPAYLTPPRLAVSSCVYISFVSFLSRIPGFWFPRRPHRSLLSAYPVRNTNTYLYLSDANRGPSAALQYTSPSLRSLQQSTDVVSIVHVDGTVRPTGLEYKGSKTLQSYLPTQAFRNKQNRRVRG